MAVKMLKEGHTDGEMIDFVKVLHNHPPPAHHHHRYHIIIIINVIIVIMAIIIDTTTIMIIIISIRPQQWSIFQCNGMVNIFFQATIDYDGFLMVLTPLDHHH